MTTEPIAGLAIATFAAALRAKKVPVEPHAFETGRHCSGRGGRAPALSHLPDLLQEWMRGRGLLTAP
jgi:hypothetical protein